jgi:plastocyanin
MKLHSKLALIACCAAMISPLNSKADTIQVQVGPAGALKFSPQDVTINVGDTIQWVWASNHHSSTSGTPGNPDGLWDSGILNKNATFSHTFTTPGVFPYYCTPHGSLGMVGSVTVNDNASDTVTITKAQYTTSRTQLLVQATDSNPAAVLTVSVTSTGEVLGTLRTRGDGNYQGKFTVTANPVNVTVSSDLGGTDSAPVRVR